MAEKAHIMKVKCIDTQGVSCGRLEVDNTYYLDKDSLYIDPDGDAFAEVYADSGMKDPIGNRKLSHFRSILK